MTDRDLWETKEVGGGGSGSGLSDEEYRKYWRARLDSRRVVRAALAHTLVEEYAADDNLDALEGALDRLRAVSAEAAGTVDKTRVDAYLGDALVVATEAYARNGDPETAEALFDELAGLTVDETDEVEA
jgi:hypothetical protein